MISIRWRKIFRDLWVNRTRSFLIVLTIAVGVFALGAISATQIVLQGELPRRYQQIDPAHIVFTTSLADDELVEGVSHRPDVAAVEGRRNVAVRLLQDPARGTWRDLFLFGLADFETQRVYKIWPVSGQWPPEKGTLLMERGSLAYLGLNEGQEVTIKTAEGRERTLRISGLAHDLYHMPAFLEGTVYAFVTDDTLEWLGQEPGYNEIYVRVEAAPHEAATMRRITEDINEYLEDAGLVVYYTYRPAADSYPMDYIADTVVLLLSLLGTLILLLGAFLVINTITALIAQQTRQIGVIKAVGGRASQVAGIYLGLVFLLGLAGTLLALPFSFLGAGALIEFVAGLLNYDVRMDVFPWQALLLQLAVGLLIPLGVTLPAILAGARRPPAQALSEYAASQVWGGMRWVDRILKHVPHITRPILLSLRNPFRRRSRLVFSLIMLALAGGSFITVINLRASLQQTVDNMLAFWQYDFWVDLNRPYPLERLRQEALRVPGVQEVEGWNLEYTRRLRPDSSESNPLMLFGVPPESGLISPHILQGRWLQNEDTNAIVVGSGLLNAEPDLALGSQMTLKVDGEEQSFRIVGIMEMLGNQTVGYTAYTSYSYYSQIAHKSQRAGILIVSTQPGGEAAPPAATPDEKRAIATHLETHFDRAGIDVRSVLQMVDERLEINSAFDIIIALLMIMVTLLAFVGGLGLMGTMSLNVIERAREVGVIRAFGGSNTAVFRIVALEGVAIGALSWIFSLLLALPLTALFCRLIGLSFLDMPLAYRFSPWGALLWLGLVSVLAVLSSALPAWNAVRLTVRQVLSYE